MISSGGDCLAEIARNDSVRHCEPGLWRRWRHLKAKHSDRKRYGARLTESSAHRVASPSAFAYIFGMRIADDTIEEVRRASDIVDVI